MGDLEPKCEEGHQQAWRLSRDQPEEGPAVATEFHWAPSPNRLPNLYDFLTMLLARWWTQSCAEGQGLLILWGVGWVRGTQGRRKQVSWLLTGSSGSRK